MSVKDKIIIFLIILFIVIFGVLIKVDADDIEIEYGWIFDEEVTSDKALALYMGKNADTFIDMTYDPQWKNVNLHVYFGKNDPDSTIASKYAVCYNEGQGAPGEGAMNIVNVIDVKFDNIEKKYKLHVDGGDAIEADGADSLAAGLAYAAFDANQETENGIFSFPGEKMVNTLIEKGFKKGILKIDDSFNLQTNGLEVDQQTEYTNYMNDYIAHEPIKNEEKVTINYTTSNGETVIGPFKISCNKEATGTDITWIDFGEAGNTMDNTELHVQFSTNSVEWAEFDKWLPINTEIYLKVNREISSKQFNLYLYDKGRENTKARYEAKILLLKNSYAKQQNLVLLVAKEVPNNISYTCQRNDKPATLTINKYGKNESNPQSNVYFKILNSKGEYATFDGLTTTDENGTNIYKVNSFGKLDEQANQACITGQSGSVKIQGLNTGDTYTIRETYNDNDNYRNYINIIGAVCDNGKSSTNVYKESQDDWVINNMVGGIKLNSDDSGVQNVLKIIDDPSGSKDEKASIDIEKYGEVESNPQANVNFQITNGSGFAVWDSSREENGVNIYHVSSFEGLNNQNNQIFSTGSSGKIRIEGLNTADTYIIRETYNNNDKYKDYINITSAVCDNGKSSVNIYKDGSDDWVVNNMIGGIRLNADDSGVPNTLKIIDLPQGSTHDKNKYLDINIIKTDLSDNKRISGAEFRIKVLYNNIAQGWLNVNDSGGYEYKTEYNNSKVWTTDSSGTIKILKLSAQYTYQIYETKQATGYEELKNQIDKGMTVKIGNTPVDDLKYIQGAKTSDESNDFAARDDSIYCGTVSYSDNLTSVEILISNYKNDSGRRSRTEVLIMWILREKSGLTKLIKTINIITNTIKVKQENQMLK